MDQTILYVDDLISGPTMPEIGSVRNTKTMAYNNEIMLRNELIDFTDSLNANNQVQVIGKAGRYLYLTGISLDDKHYGMFFIDFRKNRKMALKMVSRFDSEDHKPLFMEMFDFIVEHYEQDYYKVKLVKGEPPL